jgi:hypothetical protein
MVEIWRPKNSGRRAKEAGSKFHLFNIGTFGLLKIIERSLASRFRYGKNINQFSMV